MLIYKEDWESKPRLFYQKHTDTNTKKLFLQLMEKIVMVIKRMMWKAIYFSNNKDNENDSKTMDWTKIVKLT